MFNLTPLKIDFILGLIVVLVILVAVYVHQTKGATKTDQSAEGLGLQDTIKKVKADLMQANDDNTAPMFKVKTFDLELNFVVRDRRAENAGIEFKVITLGGEQESSVEKVQKIILRMETIETKVSQNDRSKIKSDATPKPLNSPPPEKER